MEPAPPVTLYLHIPFCRSICPYCDFVVYAGASARGPRSRVAELVGALATELDLRADALDERFGRDRPPLGSLYLGGGTPSLLDPADLARLVALVRERYGLVDDAEITLEANPGPDERGDLGGFAVAGVTRLSVGAQSLDAGELRRLGRRHRPADVGETVAAARAAGIGSVGLDLLYDLPGAELATWTSTLEAALALDPDHLSLYALTLDDPDAEGLTGPGGDHLPTRPGARRWRAAAAAEQDEDRAAAGYEAATALLARRGWRGYELSNWARPGQESRHNLAYWRRLPYAAAGPGAHAFDGERRSWNAARLEPYLEALAARRLPPGGEERLDERTAAAEALILALRTDEGASESLAADPRFVGPLAAAIGDGLAARVGVRVVLTPRGRLLANEVFAHLV